MWSTKRDGESIAKKDEADALLEKPSTKLERAEFAKLKEEELAEVQNEFAELAKTTSMGKIWATWRQPLKITTLTEMEQAITRSVSDRQPWWCLRTTIFFPAAAQQCQES